MHRLLQFTLDLFDPEPPVVAKPVIAAAPSAAAVPPAPSTPAAPAVPFDQVMAQAVYRHPKASREFLIGQSLVAYEFRRMKRKNIGFVVGPEGLVVSAPKWVPLYEIDAAVREKGSWILRKLAEAEERKQRIDAVRIEWKDGATIPFMGEQVIVVLDPRHGFSDVGGVLNTDAQALPGVPRLTLHIGLPHHATPQQIRDAVQAWLMRQARQLFTERLNHYAPLLGVQWRKLALSSAGTRWGTAHSDGSIRLNWRLIHFKLPVIDYVVAHELSHLRVMDHSPRFWETVSTVMPDYAQLRGQLRDEALPPW